MGYNRCISFRYKIFYRRRRAVKLVPLPRIPPEKPGVIILHKRLINAYILIQLTIACIRIKIHRANLLDRRNKLFLELFIFRNGGKETILSQRPRKRIIVRLIFPIVVQRHGIFRIIEQISPLPIRVWICSVRCPRPPYQIIFFRIPVAIGNVNLCRIIVDETVNIYDITKLFIYGVI